MKPVLLLAKPSTHFVLATDIHLPFANPIEWDMDSTLIYIKYGHVRMKQLVKKSACDFEFVNFKHNLGIDILCIQVYIALEYMPKNLTDS